MKVGDYVRTKKHGIGKIIGQNCNGWFELDLLNVHSMKKYCPNVSIKNNKYYIIKSSPNIIDLIEVGDYVNGVLVESIYQRENDKLYIHSFDTEIMMCFTNNNINSIVTREQFETMQYKVGE